MTTTTTTTMRTGTDTITITERRAGPVTGAGSGPAARADGGT